MGVNNVCFIGGDPIGSCLCAVKALKCPEIRFTVLDNEKTVIEWYSDHLPFYEPDLADIVKKCRNRNLIFSSDYPTAIKEADMIFISINESAKPQGEEGRSMNFKELENAAKLITAYAISDKIVVEKSTFCAKATERINTIFNSYCVPGVNIEVISCPLLLTEGSAVRDLLNPDGVLIGIKNNPKSRAAAYSLKEIYERWVPSESILIINVKSAELAHLATNVFLAQRIASFNSLAQICEVTGGDISEISKIMGKYSYIGPKYLKASLQLEGFNKEVSNLVSLCESAKYIESASYWQGVLDINKDLKRRFLERFYSILKPVREKEIGIWGFSYKKNTSNTKFSPAIEICANLLVRGAKIKIFDPQVQKKQILKDLETGITDLGQKARETQLDNVLICDDPYTACENTEAVILITDWDEFLKLHYSKVASLMKKPVIFDGRRVLDISSLKSSGIEIYSLGLSNSL